MKTRCRSICVAQGEKPADWPMDRMGVKTVDGRAELVCPASVSNYPTDSSRSPTAFVLLLCVVGCCVVLDTRRSLVSAKGTRKPKSTNPSQIRNGFDSDSAIIGFRLIQHTNVREGTTDHKPPLRHRATWERCASARARKENGEWGGRRSPINRQKETADQSPE
jgi:hypothetical protein